MNEAQPRFTEQQPKTALPTPWKSGNWESYIFCIVIYLCITGYKFPDNPVATLDEPPSFFIKHFNRQQGGDEEKQIASTPLVDCELCGGRMHPSEPFFSLRFLRQKPVPTGSPSSTYNHNRQPTLLHHIPS